MSAILRFRLPARILAVGLPLLLLAIAPIRGRAAGPVLSVSGSEAPATLSVDLPFGGAQSLRLTPDTEMPNTDPGTDLQTFQGTFVWVEYDPTSLEITKLLPLQELQRLHGRI